MSIEDTLRLFHFASKNQISLWWMANCLQNLFHQKIYSKNKNEIIRELFVDFAASVEIFSDDN